jgi:hypothetical protein
VDQTDPPYGCGYSVTWPAILGIRGVQTDAEGHQWRELPISDAVVDHSEPADYLRGFLNALRGTAALIVFATGAFTEASQAFLENERVPSEVPLLYGALFAASVAFIYLPAHSARRSGATQVVHAHCPIPHRQDAQFLPAIERRTKLAALLQLNETTKESLEKGFVIASPLLAGLISAFTSGS